MIFTNHLIKVAVIFLDISEAFDKVWHEVIIFKLKQNGISGNLLELWAIFLKDRKQRVVLNGKVFNWAYITAGVYQGSILGPLMLFFYINDLATGLSSNAKIFADDTSLFSVTHNINTFTNKLNNDSAKINNSAFQWKMSFNPDSSKQT